MFMTHHAPPNGLDPGDRMPGLSSLNDEMDDLMTDWSWRDSQGQTDPGYVYTPADIEMYGVWVEAFPGETMPALKPWSFTAYVGPVTPPTRIGG